MKKYWALFFIFGSSVNSAELAREVLSMATLEKTELEELIADQNYAANEQALVSNLEEELIDQIRALGIDRQDPKAMTALFLTQNVVNLNAALYAAANVANGDIHSSYEDSALNSTLNEILNPAWKAAAYAAKSAANDVGKNACKEAWYVARSAAKDAISQAAQAALPIFNTEMEQTRCRLASLYVLAFIAHEDFLRDHFAKAYQNIFEAIQNDVDFHQTSEGILKIIADAIWNNSQQPELAKNLFAISLRRILTVLY